MDHAYLWGENSAVWCVWGFFVRLICMSVYVGLRNKLKKKVCKMKWASDFEVCSNLDLASGQYKAKLCVCVCVCE